MTRLDDDDDEEEENVEGDGGKKALVVVAEVEVVEAALVARGVLLADACGFVGLSSVADADEESLAVRGSDTT